MRSIRFALIPLVTCASLPLFAAEGLPGEETVTWYDVEMIVFRHLETRSTETWPTDAGVPDIENARPLFPLPQGESRENALREAEGATTGARTGMTDAAMPSNASTDRNNGGPTPYVPLDESAYQLDGVMGSLQRSSLYEPILHVAWTQPPLDRAQAPYLRVTLPPTGDPGPEEPALVDPAQEPLLDGGEGLAGETDSTDGMTPESMTEMLPEDAEKLFDDELEPDFVRPLDGVVQLSVSRYLHFDIDLLYLPDDLNMTVLGDVPAATKEWTESERQARKERQRNLIEALARGDITLEEAEILALEPEERVFQGFRLDQFRRLRSREIHYFDHPVFGAVVTVTPREVSVRTLNGLSTDNGRGGQRTSESTN